MTSFLVAVSLIAYLTASILVLLVLANKLTVSRILLIMIASIAIVAHAVLLHQWIDISAGQNLSVFNLLSLVIWLIATLVLISALYKPVESLGIVIFPLAIISITLAGFFPGTHILRTANYPEQLIHILLSVVTVSILCVAALQAMLLLIQERLLHRRPTGSVIHKLPPLQMMETFLFQTTWLGFLLLSIVIASSIYSFHDLIPTRFFHKTVLTAAAWIIFAILLIGRHGFGWRGKRAVYFTLMGVMLLFIA